MIKYNKYKRRLDKLTLTKFRSLARHGSDLDLENFLYAVAMNYIAAVRGTDYIKEEDYINIKEYTYQVECPYCNKMFELDLSEQSIDDVTP